jgi:hypothetical protein
MTRSRSKCPDKNLYGKFDLDMSTHLDLAALTPITVGRQEPMVATVL